MMGRILYGSLFLVLLPALLILWAHAAEPNVTLPAYGGPITGYSIAACGLALMLVAMQQLWRMGKGLPMNAFPPPNLVFIEWGERVARCLPPDRVEVRIAALAGDERRFEVAGLGPRSAQQVEALPERLQA